MMKTAIALGVLVAALTGFFAGWQSHRIHALRSMPELAAPTIYHDDPPLTDAVWGAGFKRASVVYYVTGEQKPAKTVTRVKRNMCFIDAKGDCWQRKCAGVNGGECNVKPTPVRNRP